MFIGHYAIAFGLKGRAPQVSLGTLFLASLFIDLLWPTFLLLGWERAELSSARVGPPLEFTHYPLSHSLAMVGVWSAVVAGAYFVLRRDRRGAIVIAAAVLSHWFLDLLVHYPDLPLLPADAARYGFGLWSSVAASLALELGLFAFGLAFYLRSTTPRNRVGRIGLWLLAGFLFVVQLANAFPTPPPSIAAVAWVGQAQWLLVLAAYWVDAHRTARPRAAAPV